MKSGKILKKSFFSLEIANVGNYTKREPEKTGKGLQNEEKVCAGRDGRALFDVSERALRRF
jgi:hypothetical protein